jgi:YegS/Rv2252/BmrU family lipid kinase
MEKITAIINPISGTASKKRIPALLDQYIPQDKFEMQFFFTEYPGHAFELANQAVRDKVDYIIAVGGDGTVNEVAKALVDSTAVLGIIPMGSGNGLARDLSIPMDIKKAMEVIMERNVKTIDYCKANDHIFFCTCGVGFDASVSKRFAEEKRRGPWTYLKDIITEYVKFQPDIYEIILENKEVLTKKAFLVTCANASQYGNNAFIAPHADMNDGIIDVAVVSPITPWNIATLVVQMFTKQMRKNSKVEYYRTKKLTLKKKKSGAIHIDGEPIYMGETISIEAFHSGLHVIAPLNPMPQVYDVPSFFSYITRLYEDIKPEKTVVENNQLPEQPKNESNES